jgi:hypothetical protein
MISLKNVPHGIAEIKETYDNPDVDGDGILDLGWAQKNLVVRPLPWPMRLSWNGETINRVQAHRLIVDSMLDALYEVGCELGMYELNPAIQDIKARKWDLWGGCFNWRNMRQYPVLSVHAFGAAVDICPALGRQGVTADAATYPQVYVQAFKKRGWIWGGDWRAPWLTDAMHFQACSGY